MSDIAFRDDAADWFENDAMRQFFPLGVWASIIFSRSADFDVTVQWALGVSIEFDRSLVSEFEASNFMSAAISFNREVDCSISARKLWEKDVTTASGVWDKVEEDDGIWTKVEEAAGIWTKENS